MEKAATTIRVRPSTAKLLEMLGRKGETYDQIIRKLLPHPREYDSKFLRSLDKTAKEPSIPEDRIPWNKIYELDEDELDELLGTL